MKRPSPEPTLPLDVPKKTRAEDRADGEVWIRDLSRPMFCGCGHHKSDHAFGRFAEDCLIVGCNCLQFEREK